MELVQTIVPLKLDFAAQKKGGRAVSAFVDTGLLARTLPIVNKEHTNAHRWDACALFQKSKNKRLLVSCECNKFQFQFFEFLKSRIHGVYPDLYCE